MRHSRSGDQSKGPCTSTEEDFPVVAPACQRLRPLMSAVTHKLDS